MAFHYFFFISKIKIEICKKKCQIDSYGIVCSMKKKKIFPRRNKYGDE